MRDTHPKMVAAFHRGFTPGEPDECWPWERSLMSSGYGQCSARIDGIPATTGAHRVALALELGREILPGHHAMHSCDSKTCVNPAHLEEGSPQDNSDQAVARRRTYRVHSEAKVAAIREARAAGATYPEIARRFGVATSYAWNVVNRRVRKVG